MTDMTENVTFLQLRCQVVIIKFLKTLGSSVCDVLIIGNCVRFLTATCLIGHFTQFQCLNVFGQEYSF